MPESRLDTAETSAGVPGEGQRALAQRWVTLWERLPGGGPALLDRFFVARSLEHSRGDGSGSAGGRLPQG